MANHNKPMMTRTTTVPNINMLLSKCDVIGKPTHSFSSPRFKSEIYTEFTM